MSSGATLQALLGVEFPIIQAPMAGVQDAQLAIAVSNAGALGSLPAAMLSSDQLRDQLRVLRAGTTKPFNVNFFCHRAPALDADREARWHAQLAPYYAELGLDATAIPSGPARAAFNDELAELLAEVAPPVVSFHFGLPAPRLVERVKSWGAVILSSATTVDEARWLEAHGADAIIAQGVEAGGHRGMFLTEELTTQVGTLALVPQIARATRLPVIAAGGIADARGIAAARALGAAGAQIGTAFLLCPEALTTPLHRAALQSPAAQHTALTNLYTGRPARRIVGRLMRELGAINPSAPAFPLAGAALAPLRAAAERTGNAEFTSLWAGQNTSGCKAIPAAQLVRELAGG